MPAAKRSSTSVAALRTRINAFFGSLVRSEKVSSVLGYVDFDVDRQCGPVPVGRTSKNEAGMIRHVVHCSM